MSIPRLRTVRNPSRCINNCVLSLANHGFSASNAKLAVEEGIDCPVLQGIVYAVPKTHIPTDSGPPQYSSGDALV